MIDVTHRTGSTKTRRTALAAVLAAMYFLLRSVPIFPMIGISARFSASDFLLTGIAILAGPWTGVLAVFIGTLLAYPITGTPFLGLDFIPGIVNVLVTGLVLRRHRGIAVALYASILLVFVVSPYSLLFGYWLVPYAWLHIIAFVVLCSPVLARTSDWQALGESRRVVVAAGLAFVGTMAQHLTGGLLYEFTLGVVQGNSVEFFIRSWQFIFFAYPYERLALVIGSTIIAAALMKATRRLGVFHPPKGT